MDARISTAFPQHHKTKKLARRLGAEGPLGCMYLFLWAAANRSDGNLFGMSDEDVELAIDWCGSTGAFVKAMVEVGFLDGDEGARTIHDWAEHNPWAAGAEARSEKARWAALCMRHGRSEAARQMPGYAERLRQGGEERARSERGADCEQAGPEPSAQSGSAPSPLPSPPPFPSSASPSGARLPAGWRLPDDWRAWAERERPDIDVAREAASFADHWHGKAGKDARKADWLATWRNWIRRANVPSAFARPNHSQSHGHSAATRKLL